jgi:hypothetical protein
LSFFGVFSTFLSSIIQTACIVVLIASGGYPRALISLMSFGLIVSSAA